MSSEDEVQRSKRSKVDILTSEQRVFANDLIDFLNESCTAFHAVDASKKRLDAAGFSRLSEDEVWVIKPGGKYYFTRNTTSLIAFTVGGDYQPGNGFTVMGAHSDSPCLKVKPVTCFSKGDALVLNTQPYGGGLWHTWFDRDLGLAGRVIYKSKADGSLKSRLVRINRPIARIPNLAIHLTAGKERESFDPNLQEHAKAILSMDRSFIDIKFADAATTEKGSTASVVTRLHPALVHLIAAELEEDHAASSSAATATATDAQDDIEPEDIVDLELQLIDVQPSCFGGASGELIYSGRLDNLCSSYQILRAIIDGASGADDAIATQTNVRVTVLFDHEEIGSASCQGAASSMFVDTLRLISDALTDATHGVFMRSLRKSFVVSIDMAHAHHPNYLAKHDTTMAPKINGGLVIKHNANQRYATNAVSASIFREVGRLANVPVQEFTVRSDSACGSTIGPILATLSGILTVDIGTPQFSMHSIRETMGSRDAHTGYAHLKALLRHHPALAKNLNNA